MARNNAIDVRETIIVVAVRDAVKAKGWYSKLFGKEPDLEPFPGNIEFKIGGAWVQVSKGKVTPSSWTLTLEVRDLQKERERLRSGGIDATEISTVPGVIKFFDLKDPDGNAMRWFQVLTKDERVTGGRSD